MEIDAFPEDVHIGMDLKERKKLKLYLPWRQINRVWVSLLIPSKKFTLVYEHQFGKWYFDVPSADDLKDNFVIMTSLRKIKKWYRQASRVYVKDKYDRNRQGKTFINTHMIFMPMISFRMSFSGS